MPRRPAARSRCPISLALEQVGDPWSLLIVRDLLFKGLRTFSQFQAAGEGIASNILADRLARLTRAGILQRTRDPADRRRLVYGLTPKGAALAPVLVDLVVWSARYADTDAPPAVVRDFRTRRAAVLRRVQAPWGRSPTT